ncbi:helix-turn-helix domain-containing protein [Altibacter sp.]|uniref:helix-turn-helix domain-containing protein n=1 Tax=Altibacter sp. TaxID=2024823 RepID=UPI00258582CA|nr:helix-turn-helix domain-containing protein [Altibacter sp.]MCW9037607.1 helix-turn-helix domain-containing protein [Altibacter sp.]
MRLPLLILSLLALTGSMLGQSTLPNDLNLLVDEELLSLFNEVDGDSIAQERIARVYLERARMEKDTIKMARGYDRLARIYHPERNIQFADSVIVLTKSMKHITYPALGYILKGYQYLRLNDLTNATKNFLLAYELAEKRENVHQLIYLTKMIVSDKIIWGNKRNALSMQKHIDSIISNENFIDVIKKSSRSGLHNSLGNQLLREKITSKQNLAFCYLNLKVLDSAELYVEEAQELLLNFFEFDRKGIEVYSTTLLTKIYFYKKEYVKSLKIIDSLLVNESIIFEHDVLMDLYYYKGMSLTELGYEIEALDYLKKADSIHSIGDVSIQPYDRQLFEALLNYYKKEDNNEMQLKYLDKIIQIDSISKINYQYFEPEMIRYFETPRLLAEKEELINKLESKNRMASLSNGAIISLLLLSTFGLYYYFNRQLLYKRRFKELIAYTQNENFELNSQYSNLSKPSNELVENILQSLVVFERNKEYLSQKISLGYLSKRLDTNSKYLSQVINMEKDKSFTQYINDLRVTYAFKKLAADPVFRKYTIKAIAWECGFKTGESFSKSFYKKYGIYPSYYLKSLEKKESPD